MKLKIEMNLDNAAFDGVHMETAELLRQIARDLEGEPIVPMGYRFLDSNGNAAGTVKVLK